MGLSGVRRGRSWVRTTITGDGTERPADLVERNFTAPAPNRLWLADLTYLKTRAGDTNQQTTPTAHHEGPDVSDKPGTHTQPDCGAEPAGRSPHRFAARRPGVPGRCRW
jgi:hypothetical protein